MIVEAAREAAKVDASIRRIVIQRHDADGNYLGSYVIENGELRETHEDGHD